MSLYRVPEPRRNARSRAARHLWGAVAVAVVGVAALAAQAWGGAFASIAAIGWLLFDGPVGRDGLSRDRLNPYAAILMVLGVVGFVLVLAGQLARG